MVSRTRKEVYVNLLGEKYEMASKSLVDTIQNFTHLTVVADIPIDAQI